VGSLAGGGATKGIGAGARGEWLRAMEEGGCRSEMRRWSMVTSSWRRGCQRGQQREPEAAGAVAGRVVGWSAHAIAGNSSFLGGRESTQADKYL
jgi:hypothetical protein